MFSNLMRNTGIATLVVPLALITSTHSITVCADTLAHYDFEDMTPDLSGLPSSDAAGSSIVTVSDINDVGIPNIADDHTRDSSNIALPSTALVLSPAGVAAAPPSSTDDFLFFSLTNDSTNALNLEFLTFDWGLSSDLSSGMAAEAQLFWSDGGAYTPVGAGQNKSISGNTFSGMDPHSIDLSSLSSINPDGTILFRLGFADNSGLVTTDKGQYIDNVMVTGALVPEPSSLALAFSLLATMGLWAAGRRIRLQ